METFLKLLPSLIAGAVALAGMLGLFALLRDKLGAWADWLATKTRIAKLANLDEMLWGFLHETGSELQVALKDVLADGKITKEERQRLVGIVVLKAKSHFGLDWLKGFVADVGSDALDSFLRARTEREMDAAATGAPQPLAAAEGKA